MLRTQLRFFAAPAKPAAKGGPPSAAPYVPLVVHKTPFEKMIENGQEFILGPPPGVNKIRGAHRDTAIPKLEPRIDIFAKKLREHYIREGVLPDQKHYIEYTRDRLPDDTIDKLIPQKLIPGT